MRISTLLLISVFFVSLEPALAREPYKITTAKAEVVAGHSANGNTINAVEITFPESIFTHHFDSARNEMVVLLRKHNDKVYKNRGGMGVLDMATHQIKWSKEIQGDRFKYEYTEDKIILDKFDETVAYDRNSGQRLWSLDRGMSWIDPDNKIGLEHDGEAIDLNTGKTKWETDINKRYGWQELVYLDEKNILIAATGLKKINLADGSGWYYEMKTGYDNYGSMAGKAAAGLAVGLLTGMAVVPTGPDVVYALSSNIVVDGNYIYHASRDEVVCIDKNGKVKWSKELPDKQTGNSTIWIKNEELYLLNSAYGYCNGAKVNKGVPYIAAFQKSTGTPVYLTELGSQDMLISTGFMGDTLYAHSGKMLHKYDLRSGTKLLEVIAADFKLDKHKHFLAGNMLYIKTRTGQYKSLSEMYPGEKFLSGANGIARVNKNLQFAGAINDELWTWEEKYGGMDIIENKNEIKFIKDGKEIAALKVGRAAIYGDMLVDAQETKLRLIDLSSLPK